MAKEDVLTFNPSKGIAISPLSENAYSQCIDSDTVNGVSRVNFKTVNDYVNQDNYQDTFTAEPSTDVITMATANDWDTGLAFTVINFSGSLPSPLAGGTVYYLRNITSNTYTFHTTYDGAQNNIDKVDITTAGTGTFYINLVELAEIKKIKNNYCIDEDGNLWQLSAYSQLELLSKGSGSGNGMEVYDGYVYMFRGGDIDRYKISDGTVTADWQTDAGDVSLVGQDDTMYIGVGNLVRSYDGTTYNSSALDLPSGESIKCLAEIGRYLAIGTRQGNIFLWDRVSSSFELPIKLPADVEMLISANNLLYAVIESGDIYITNESSTTLLVDFPKHIFDQKDNPSLVFNADAYRIQDRDIYIGYGSTSTTSPMGVYKLNINTNKFTLAFIASSGAIGGSSADRIKITAIQNSDTGSFYIGWEQANTTYGFDEISLTARYETEAIAYSGLYRVGTEYNKNTFKHTEVNLSEPLDTGCSVSVYYRKNLRASWTLIGTFDEVNKTSKVLDQTIAELVNIQFKVIIGTAGTTTTPNLIDIKCY